MQSFNEGERGRMKAKILALTLSLALGGCVVTGPLYADGSAEKNIVVDGMTLRVISRPMFYEAWFISSDEYSLPFNPPDGLVFQDAATKAIELRSGCSVSSSRLGKGALFLHGFILKATVKC